MVDGFDAEDVDAALSAAAWSADGGDVDVVLKHCRNSADGEEPAAWRRQDNQHV